MNVVAANISSVRCMIAWNVVNSENRLSVYPDLIKVPRNILHHKSRDPCTDLFCISI
jgi:hypothetical protein